MRFMAYLRRVSLLVIGSGDLYIAQHICDDGFYIELLFFFTSNDTISNRCEMSGFPYMTLVITRHFILYSMYYFGK